jgi:predicted CoA-binding protein
MKCRFGTSAFLFTVPRSETGARKFIWAPFLLRVIALGNCMSYSDAFLKDILTRTRTIAVVGVSLNPVRPSYYVARYLSLKGYTVFPINPGHAGKRLFGREVLPDLAALDQPVDMVDIFRRSEAVPTIVDTALAQLSDLKTIWMQIGVEHPEAATQAEAAGLDVVQNRCPKIEYQRLFGELRMGGFNTGVISSKL